MTPKERPPVKWLLQIPLSREKMIIYRQTAIEVGVPFRIIPKDQIRDPFELPQLGEVRIEILYGEKYAEFNKRLRELSPPPPPRAIPSAAEYMRSGSIEPSA